MERADEVLALGQVHRRSCRRSTASTIASSVVGHLHDRDAAVVHRRGEPGDVADETAADRDDRVVAAQPEAR